MKITPLEIQQRRFRVRFRGFDVREVDAFLEQVSETMEALEAKNRALNTEIQQLGKECRAFTDREQTFKQALDNSQQVLERMNENARQSAEVIVSDAEVKAEKLLNRAHNRLVQLNEDISELRRQRMQIESQVRAVLDTHVRLLDMANAEMIAMDEEFDKIRLLKKNI